MSLQHLVQKHYDNASGGDLEADAEIFSPQVVTRAPGEPPMIGFEPFLRYLQRFRQAFPDSVLTVESCIESDDTVAVEGTLTGTHTGPFSMAQGDLPATHKAINLPFCDVFRFAGDMVVDHSVYIDRMEFLSQLGLA